MVLGSVERGCIFQYWVCIGPFESRIRLCKGLYVVYRLKFTRVLGV